MTLNEIAQAMWAEIHPRIPITTYDFNEESFYSEDWLRVLEKAAKQWCPNLKLLAEFDGDRRCWEVAAYYHCCDGMQFPTEALAYLTVIQQAGNTHYNLRDQVLYHIRRYEPISTEHLLSGLLCPQMEVLRELKVLAETRQVEWDANLRWIVKRPMDISWDPNPMVRIPTPG